MSGNLRDRSSQKTGKIATCSPVVQPRRTVSRNNIAILLMIILIYIKLSLVFKGTGRYW